MKARLANYFPAIVAQVSVMMLASLIAASRDFDVGSDTLTYLNHFKAMLIYGLDYKFEPAFNLLVFLSSSVLENFRFFLFLTAQIFFLSYWMFFNCIFSQFGVVRRFGSTGFLFVAFVLFSDWYFVAVSNALRQGLSIPFLFFSFYYFVFKRSLVKGGLMFASSAAFHESAFLFLPFVIISFFPFRLVCSFWLVLAAFYVLGFNEIIVRFLSSFLSFDVYSFIKFYSVEDGNLASARFLGFEWRFFVYTVFWPLLFAGVFLFRASALAESDKAVLLGVVQIYLILSMVFFVFGFGPFSNRYAFPAWLFIPTIQMAIFLALKFSKGTIPMFGLFGSAMGFFIFSVKMHFG